MNVLYLSYDGMTDPLGQSQVLPYLIGLSAKGYRFTLISFEKADKFKKNESYVKSVCNKSAINWLPFKYHNKPPVLGTLYDIFTLQIQIKRITKKEKTDLIHCRSYITALAANATKDAIGVPWLFDMRGLWIDEKIDGKIWQLSNPIYRLIFRTLKKKEVKLLCDADGIVTLTHRVLPELDRIAKIRLSENKRLAVIPCCTDPSFFNPNNVDSEMKRYWRNKLGIEENAFVLCYLGSFSTWYLPKEMILFYKTLLEFKPDAQFLIITPENPEILRRIANDEGLNGDKLIITEGNRNIIPQLLSLATASICFIKNAYSKMASSPTKLAELLAMGIPVVCNAGIGDTDEILKKVEGGVICHELTPDGFRRIIPDLISQSNLENKQQIRESSISVFDVGLGVQRYAEIYSQITHNQS